MDVSPHAALKDVRPENEVIVGNRLRDGRRAVEATKAGAFYLSKTFRLRTDAAPGRARPRKCQLRDEARGLRDRFASARIIQHHRRVKADATIYETIESAQNPRHV